MRADLSIAQSLADQLEDQELLIGQQGCRSTRLLFGPDAPDQTDHRLGVQQRLAGSNRADRRHQVVAADVLEDESSCAGDQGVEQCVVVGVRREHQSGGARVGRRQFSAQFHTVTVGKSDVHDNHVGSAFGYSGRGFANTRRLANNVESRYLVQQVCQSTTDDLVVVDQIDADRHGGHLFQLTPAVDVTGR